MKTGGRAIAFIASIAIAGAVLFAPSTASAEETSLCKEDRVETPKEHELPCPKEKVSTHIHLVSNAETQKVKLVTSSSELEDTECNALVLADAIEPSGAPLLLKGNVTYSNCTSKCTLEVIEGEEPPIFEVLKIGFENAEVRWPNEDVLFAKCPLWNCYFSGAWNTTYIGPLLSIVKNGEIAIYEREMFKVKGTSCPFKTLLTARFEPLELLFIAKGIEG